MKKMKHLGIIALAAVLLALVTGCKHDPEPEPIPKTYTVTLNSSGGSSVNPQTVTAGGKASEPAAPTKANDVAGLYAGTPPASYTLDGWYNGGAKWNFASDAVTADITLTAKWAAPPTIDLAGASGNNVVEKAVSYVNANPGSAYTLVLGEDVSGVASVSLANLDDTSLTITSYGNTERKIIFSENQYMEVGGYPDSCSGKLIIDGHVTLERIIEGGYYPLIFVYLGGSIDLKGNSKITGISSGQPASCILVVGGSITMSDEAEISNSTTTFTSAASAIYLSSMPAGTSSFTMNGDAKIKNKTGRNGNGGGVFISTNCTFIMNGGIISNNTADYGGGVSGHGTFIMNGGEISNNTAATRGGGVDMNAAYSVFTVANEEIKAGIHGNSAPTNPQVFVAGTFTVEGMPAASY
jgi:uncharacterized repeat protein (TIGR02543 family)